MLKSLLLACALALATNAANATVYDLSGTFSSCVADNYNELLQLTSTGSCTPTGLSGTISISGNTLISLDIAATYPGMRDFTLPGIGGGISGSFTGDEQSWTLTAYDNEAGVFGGSINLTDVAGVLTGTRQFWNEPGLPQIFAYSYNWSNLTGTAIAETPLPATFWLFASGLFALIGLRKKIGQPQ
jgi:hypothetical protein